MTSYRLRARHDGQTEVLEDAAVLGVFPDPVNARRFHDFMAGTFLRLVAPPAVEIEPPVAREPAAAPVDEEADTRAIARVVAAIQVARAGQPKTTRVERPSPPALALPVAVLERRKTQAGLQRGGTILCQLCSRAFMPSLSEPDTCARCAKTLER